MSELLSENVLLGMGNPLLDISATVKPELLTKHNLKANDAILTEEEKIFNDLVGEYKVDYIAGGATQNSIRVAQWILSKPNVTSYMGCVGDDDNSKKLEEKAKEAGVNVRYLQKNLPLLSVSQRVIRGGVILLKKLSSQMVKFYGLNPTVPTFLRVKMVFLGRKWCFRAVRGSGTP